MTDHTDHEWPREIWAFAIDRAQYEMSGTYVTSQFATAPRWEGDEERDRPVQRYVDADVHDSADRYWRERCEAQAARIVELEAEQAWQPIETAPKDGTEILCLLRPKVVRQCWFFARSSREFGFMDERGKDVSPTHWRYLPPAPQEGE